MSLGSHYSRDFFSVLAEGSELGARICLPICFEIVNPTSVVDVGCGIGAWAKAASDLGIADVTGIDGNYVAADQLLIPPERFVPQDLEISIALDRTFDLAVCMEVAEHLSPNRAAGFVEELTQLAPAVLFSAAIPGQGGTNHINEQWQDYWASRFAQFGFRPIDCVRPALWTDAEVPFWYRQNAILYVGPESAVSESLSAPMPLNVVHPDLLRAKQEATARPSVIRRLARKTGALLKR
jgi:SAM-dependent methyltransferase